MEAPKYRISLTFLTPHIPKNEILLTTLKRKKDSYVRFNKHYRALNKATKSKKNRLIKMEDFDNFQSNAHKVDQDRINIDTLDEAASLNSADIVKLRQENTELKKEVQAMESRLKSNMKSIKTFWSPELKKEKAAKIEQEDKFLALHEQYTTLSKEAQVFKGF